VATRPVLAAVAVALAGCGGASAPRLHHGRPGSPASEVRMIAEEAVDDDPNAGDDIAPCRLLGIASRTVDTYRCSIRYEGATLREDLTYDRLRQRYFYALRQAGEKKVARGSCALNEQPPV
jgi:hypothetical protein